MKAWKKTAALILAIATFGSLTGCSGNKSPDNVELDSITVFNEKSASLTDDMKDYNDVLSFQMMEEATGLHIDWSIPPATGLEEKFNLMITSGEYPDAITYNWKKLNCKEYAEDGVIISLNELIDENMPNLKKIFDENPEIKQLTMSADGSIYYLPYIRLDKELCIFSGPVIRYDWLEKLGLDVPKNADELLKVLRAFKTSDPNGNGKADEIPMTGMKSTPNVMSITNLLWMFDTYYGFYLDGDKVKYGPMEDNFIEGIKYIRQLYSEGLIDGDYLLQDRTGLDAKVTNDTVGFAYHYQPTKFADTMRDIDPEFELKGIPHFENKNKEKKCYDSSYILRVLDKGTAITTSCKNPADVLKKLDWLYSEAGIEAMNFGKEGVTFEAKDDKKVFTEKITNNDEGLSMNQACGKYLGAFNSYFPAVQLWDSYSNSLSPEGVEAIGTWADGVDTSGALATLSFDYDENEVIKYNMSQIQTFVNEKIDRIILSKEGEEMLEGIREKIKEMGIDEVIDIYQAAYDRNMKNME